MRNVNIHHLLVLFTVVSILAACTPAVFFPEEGEWYCEELEMQLAFDAASECFVTRDGYIIQCACIIDRGSEWLFVGCQEANCEYCALGEELFLAQFVRLDDTRLTVKEVDSGNEYTFLRVGQMKDGFLYRAQAVYQHKNCQRLQSNSCKGIPVLCVLPWKQNLAR